MKVRLSLLLALSTVAAGIVALSAQADAAVRTESPVTKFMSTEVVPSATATLLRNDNGIGATLHTSLAPGTAATLWWVIFNNPAYCSHGSLGEQCGPDDLSEPLVQASVLFAAGHVIGANGVANYGAYLSEGKLTRDVVLGSGLIDSRRAVVHLVVRTHGQADPGRIDEQIGSFNGGCNPTCMNVQAAVFEP
jgi:hypothetical protein